MTTVCFSYPQEVSRTGIRDGRFADGYRWLKLPNNPDLIVLDIGMPLMNGLNAGQRLKELIPKTKLIYLTMNMDRDIAAEAFQLGASGYLVKSSAGTELVQAIHQAISGKFYITPLMTEGDVGPFIQNVVRKRRLTNYAKTKRGFAALVEPLNERKAFMLNVAPRTIASIHNDGTVALKPAPGSSVAVKDSMVAARVIDVCARYFDAESRASMASHLKARAPEQVLFLMVIN